MTDKQRNSEPEAMQELAELLNDRHVTAYKLRKEGKTYKAVGQALGVSVERAKQMVFKAEAITMLERCGYKVSKCI